ncbi:hypothetical protein CCR85_02860 [Rhodothalassium salexigens]|nr:hypothetical protein [Rhodothalassium salexigens]MBK5919830.1 hypothetical protein [Rhodothalassium salexigens]
MRERPGGRVTFPRPLNGVSAGALPADETALWPRAQTLPWPRRVVRLAKAFLLRGRVRFESPIEVRL